MTYLLLFLSFLTGPGTPGGAAIYYPGPVGFVGPLPPAPTPGMQHSGSARNFSRNADSR